MIYHPRLSFWIFLTGLFLSGAGITASGMPAVGSYGLDHAHKAESVSDMYGASGMDGTSGMHDVSGSDDPSAHETISLREMLVLIEKKKGYRVLYRDALVSGLQVEMRVDGDPVLDSLLDAAQWERIFRERLALFNLQLRIDHDRRQVVVFRSPAEAGQVGQEPEADQRKAEQSHIGSKTALKGYVIDAETGERLPYATIVWGPYTGTRTDLQGAYKIALPADTSVTLRFSYVGYSTLEMHFEPGELVQFTELPVRLEPVPYQGAEILVSGTLFHAPSDSVYQGMLSIGRFSPAGEASSIRMLQMLPAVMHGTALSEGLMIRGSRSDAHQLLLDGAVIYNHSHLFGLIDSFSSEAIRTSRFYYDVAPARYQAPPGGTHDIITRSGSLYDYRLHAAVSSSALTAGAEGPLVKGRASWLFSGRTSLLNYMDWAGTGRLVSWGLDIDRENSLTEDQETFLDRIVTPGPFKAQFHDLHGKLFWEDTRNNRWSVSGYSGFNHTRQKADRLVLSGRPSNRFFETDSFDTSNRWGNNSLALNMYHSPGPDLLLKTSVSGSLYHTRFLKEDFVFQRPGAVAQNHLMQMHSFDHESILTHGQAAVDLLWTTESSWLYTLRFGSALNRYDSDYSENSLNRSRFEYSSRPYMAEVYGESRLSLNGPHHTRTTGDMKLAELEAGLRVSHYSEGGYNRASPRLHVRLLPDNRFSVGAGYSRTWQYLFQLSFYNLVTSDIWIMAGEGQPPASADQWSAGLYYRPGRGVLIQVETWLKKQKNLRFHEINIQSVQPPQTDAPWFSDNDGRAHGLEALFYYRTGAFAFTQSYTRSKTELRNERLNEGAWFPAYWDRRHQSASMLTVELFDGLKWHMNWLYATGSPDRLSLFLAGEERLGDYHRLDLSLQYTKTFRPASALSGSANHVLELQLGIYNLTNRKNPWYRDWLLTLDQRDHRNRLTPVRADVYDLGFHPSFTIRYYRAP